MSKSTKRHSNNMLLCHSLWRHLTHSYRPTLNNTRSQGRQTPAQLIKRVRLCASHALQRGQHLRVVRVEKHDATLKGYDIITYVIMSCYYMLLCHSLWRHLTQSYRPTLKPCMVKLIFGYCVLLCPAWSN